MGRLSDSEAMAGSQVDPREFGVIYERYFADVFRYMARRVGTHVAEDLTGDVFLRAFAARERFDPHAASARPWLYGFAANIVRDHLRQQRRRTRAYIHAAEPATTVTDLDDAVERTHAILMVPRIDRALASLKAADRETFLLHVLGELSYDDVATSLGIPVGTVRSRIARARTRLRELMSADRQTMGGGSR